jgi:hypothetical protein
MKTTLEIDDELYREAKADASLTGMKMKHFMPWLYDCPVTLK